jgi:hypothetical protein
VPCFTLPLAFLLAWVLYRQMLFHFKIAPQAFSEWARVNRFRVECQRIPLFFGPYTWSAGPFRRVYWIAVWDQDRHQHEG